MNLTLNKIQETVELFRDLPEIPRLQIYENHYLTKSKQIKFPVSKKKRIRKKWTKNLKNWMSWPDPNYYRVGDQVFCHPAMAGVLRQQIEKGNNDKAGSA